MKIHCAAILALASITADAFSTCSTQQQFSSTKLFADESSDEVEEPASGSSRFKEIMEAAKTGGGATPSAGAVPNPFLTPPPAPAAPAAAGGVNLENLSVEDQAALLRQLMANPSGGGSDPNTPPAGMKEKRTDMAGKPVGRNRDADSISNSADLYFAQLKRDSTVRTLAKNRGEDEVADAVMKDEGIKELENLLVENPYLTGQKNEEQTFFEAIPEESLGPFIHAASSGEPSENVNTSGIKYKEILKEKRSKGASQPAAAVAAPPAPVAAAAEPAPVVQQPAPQQEAAVELPPPAQPTVTSYTDEDRQKLRTFMGLLLKHRGGPGFGKGRLKGAEIDRFETMLGEITTMLREESMEAAPANVPMMTAPVAAAPVAPAVAQPAVASSGNADLAQVDGAVACIEGATMMYKNSPAQLRESLLGALRAALLGAVNTCGRATGAPEVTAEEIGGSSSAGISEIDGVIACIDGAVTMYKNSPDAVKPAMLVALRAALVSAIGMCNSVMDSTATTSVPPPASVSPVPTIETTTPPPQPQTVVSSVPSTPSPEVEPTPASPEPEVVDESLIADMGPDANSKVLQKIYDKIKAASGQGSLGLRSDLTASEASDVADSLVEMRGVLMKELNEGIPAAGEEVKEEPQPVATKVAPASSVASRYKEMLKKAKAEKEAAA
eukprot:CAMPEP_0113602584 /NCGR_PEP_ID=MMETSP0017_2-20120614/834_1 /TAXON_ID=2856 /ORGANISM="Cylindrotheca closterium" /LENGTH=668 /DNA_ID=CAMNT_0000510941 /DNA_START=55 /DNA_END=2061 /DNA_ORIENTATION=- /assembly_acc=CAM_ASM_000147